MSEENEKVCAKSPDHKHHYEMASFQHAVHVPNGSHSCYQCAFCGHSRCKTVYFGEPDKMKLPTDEDLDNE